MKVQVFFFQLICSRFFLATLGFVALSFKSVMWLLPHPVYSTFTGCSGRLAFWVGARNPNKILNSDSDVSIWFFILLNFQTLNVSSYLSKHCLRLRWMFIVNYQSIQCVQQKRSHLKKLLERTRLKLSFVIKNLITIYIHIYITRKTFQVLKKLFFILNCWHMFRPPGTHQCNPKFVLGK